MRFKDIREFSPMKQAFRKAMKASYQGQGVPMGQLRELARSFCMGWMEAVIAIGGLSSPTALASAMDASQVADFSWIPAEDWKWWL